MERLCLGGWTSATATSWTHLPRGEAYSFKLTSVNGTQVELTGGEV